MSTDRRIAQNLATLLRGVGAMDLTDVATRLPPLRQTGHDRVGSWPTAASRPSLGRRLAALFPNAAMVEVPGARTFVALDAPTAVVDAIATVGARPSAGA